MKLENGKLITNNGKPYIVAELNSSHNGKIDVAKEMIDAAKDCGCDAVKFQSWSADSLYCQDYYEQNPIARRMVNGFALKPEILFELSEYCRSVEIDFASTPYSKEEVDFLVESCHADFVKVASMDINNLSYLRYIAKKSVPIVLSTGMASVEEIETAVHEIENAGNDNICILHCVSLYPADEQLINLKNMLMLKEKFPKYSIGYSDHTIGGEVACASVALGAALIEKHFTLNNKKVGWDNQMATEPADMKMLVDGCHKVYRALGRYERELSVYELEQQKKMRRSIVASVNIPKGHKIEEADIAAKRPGDGIPINEFENIIGRIAIKDILRDHLILEDYLQKELK